MRLSEFVARTPSGRLATPDDNARILALFDQTPMAASAFAVQYERAPDFFRLLRLQSARSHVFIDVKADGRVNSVATLSLRPAWVDGQPTTVGCFSDLRVRFDRSSISRWRRFYSDLLAHAAEIDELSDCSHWYATVIDDNRSALRAFDRADESAPVHRSFAPFTMRNLVARVPGFGPRLPADWHVRRAESTDKSQLQAFFDDANRGLPFGFRGELERRFQEWDGFGASDFLVVEGKGELLACAAPWAPSEAKRTVVSRVPSSFAIAGSIARRWPGDAPFRIPRAGQPLRIQYLTNLAFAPKLDALARALAARAIIDRVFDAWAQQDWHCLAVCDFNAWHLGRALRGYVQQTVPITAYSVMSPRSARPAAPLAGTGAIGFEMAMV